MTTLRNQIGSGTAPQAAQADQGFITNSVNVTGSTSQGNQAFPSDFVVVTTAPGSAGLTLPSNAAPTDSYVLVNHGGSACLVWPPSGGKIANGSANASFSVGATKVATFENLDGTNWCATLSA